MEFVSLYILYGEWAAIVFKVNAHFCVNEMPLMLVNFAYLLSLSAMPVSFGYNFPEL